MSKEIEDHYPSRTGNKETIVPRIDPLVCGKPTGKLSRQWFYCFGGLHAGMGESFTGGN